MMNRKRILLCKKLNYLALTYLFLRFLSEYYTKIDSPKSNKIKIKIDGEPSKPILLIFKKKVHFKSNSLCGLLHIVWS